MITIYHKRLNNYPDIRQLEEFDYTNFYNDDSEDDIDSSSEIDDSDPSSEKFPLHIDSTYIINNSTVKNPKIIQMTLLQVQVKNENLYLYLFSEPVDVTLKVTVSVYNIYNYLRILQEDSPNKITILFSIL